MRDFLGSVVRPHSHDAADSIDSALESSKEGIRALKVSLVVDHDLSVWEGHDIAVEAEHRLLHALAKLDSAIVHLSPHTTNERDPHEPLAHHPTL